MLSVFGSFGSFEHGIVTSTLGLKTQLAPCHPDQRVKPIERADQASEEVRHLEFTTGKVMWKTESIGSASLAYADGRLYLHAWNGEVGMVEATAEGYREKGRFTPPNQPKKKQAGQMTENAYAYPVIANGRLYIRDLGTLWVYDIKASR